MAGLIISFALISNDSAAYYDAICSVISDKELEFMKLFEIDDGEELLCLIFLLL
jgi:hypothetical protein